MYVNKKTTSKGLIASFLKHERKADKRNYNIREKNTVVFKNCSPQSIPGRMGAKHVIETPGKRSRFCNSVTSTRRNLWRRSELN